MITRIGPTMVNDLSAARRLPTLQSELLATHAVDICLRPVRPFRDPTMWDTRARHLGGLAKV
jgi:hypothetical protein